MSGGKQKSDSTFSVSSVSSEAYELESDYAKLKNNKTILNKLEKNGIKKFFEVLIKYFFRNHHAVSESRQNQSQE